MPKSLLLLIIVLLLSFVSIGQTRTITGKVQDKSGKPLAGATVSSGKYNVVTNENGAYTINLPSGNKKVEVAMLVMVRSH